MTDTVNVPREPTDEMVEAAGNAPFSRARRETTNVYDRRVETVRDMLRAGIAAAPRAEPVSGSIAEMVSELVNEAAPDQGETPSRAFALALSLQAALASQPEAPKVEQEPVAWRYRTAPHRQWHFTPSRMDAGYEEEDGSEVQPLYTHPAPASDELLEAKAMVLDSLLSAKIDGRTAKARLIEYRTGVLAIAKHKGPQS